MSIRISPKHGVNPSIGVCFYCGEDDGTVVLPGRLKGDAEAPRRAVWSKEPCPKCKEWMRQGIILIEVRDGEDPQDENPYRTGGFAVVKEEAFKRVMGDGPMKDLILRTRWTFIEQGAAKKVGIAFGKPEAAS